MKKTLLISAALLFIAFSINAQGAIKVWNVGNDPVNFPVSAGIGAGPDKSVYVDGLGIHTGTVTNTNMGAVNASAKTFGSFTFVNRFQFNGGGYTGSVVGDVTPTVFMPTQRYLTIQVGGNSTIYVIGITGSSSETRRMFVTNGTALVGTAVFPSGSDLADATIQYTGPATTLYLFCNVSCNLHYLSATNVVLSSVKSVLADKGVTFNGKEVLNNNNLSLEVYNVLGKRVMNSTGNISVESLQKGVYFVRAAGVNDVLKFSK
jgi:hypothetical protein